VEELLTTKLNIPPTRIELVTRPRLLEQLNMGNHPGCKLTLISAPAGFGKTTLVSEWVRKLGQETPSAKQAAYQIAWLSRDEADNNPVRFVTYIIAALNRAVGNNRTVGKSTLSMLHSPQPPPIETVLTPLINELATIPDRINLVLDDYHIIESSSIDNVISYFLDYLPPQLHLVIVTREDPLLPLSRSRACGQLTELRAADLRFTSSEAAEFLNQAMGLNLSVEDIAALETRTEGWIAGLQLAAISIRGHDDAASRIRTFTGSHRLVLDYLIEEVLNQQPEAIQTFLLQTAILDRLNGSLCDAVRFGTTELGEKQDGSQEILEMLDRSNLFIIPLDGERRWYRYHHLFADLLRQRLHQTQPALESELHSRASKWYEQHNLKEEAIDHALAAQDLARAADLIEWQIDVLWERGEHAKILKWLNLLPKSLIFDRPLLSIFYTWVLLEDGKVKAAERSLQAAEQAINSMDGTATTGVQDHVIHLSKDHLKSRAAVMQAMIGFRTADVPSIIKFSNEALESLPERDISWRGIAAMALGDSHYIVGDMNGARKALSEALSISKTARNVYLTAYTSVKLAIILEYLGKLHPALEICQDFIRVMESSGLSQLGLTGVLHAQCSEILWDLNDLDQAQQFVSRGIELSEHEIDLTNLSWTNLAYVKVLYAIGDLKGAMETILKMEKIANRSHLPPWIVSRLAAWKARLWLAQGNHSAAQRWVQERRLYVDDELVFAREVEYIQLARVLIHRGKLPEAINLLERLVEFAGSGGRITRMIEMLAIQALALQAQGDTDKAMATLSRGLALAEGRGHIRHFINEGPPMNELLEQALLRDISPAYVRRLISAFSKDKPVNADSIKSPPTATELVEPLSEREIEVLQLISEGLTNQEIANRLYLSLNTVKVHTRNIYGKLDAHNRTQAIGRSQELGILTSK